MPEQVRCPSCNAALRVPETLLGQNVRCPKCQTTFLAEAEELDQPKGIAREPDPSAARRRRPSPPEEDELEELPEEEDEDRPRRRRGRRRIAEAKSMVSGPATALLVVGIIDIVSGAFGLLASIAGFALMSMDANLKRDPGFKLNMIQALVGGIGALILGPLITAGAVKMKRLTSYGFAMTACILAMIPFVNCCLLGLPFGIWALVVLNKPEVKDAFS